MKKTLTFLVIAFLSVAALVSTTSAQDAAEIMKSSHLAYYYAADDGIAEVVRGRKESESLRWYASTLKRVAVRTTTHISRSRPIFPG